MTEECNLPDGFTARAAIKTGADVQSIIQALDNLTGMPVVELASMGCCGRRLVARKYAWDSIADQMIRVYSWLAGDNNKPETVHVQ